MKNLFISHSSKDDDFVRDLRAALADHGNDVWIDSRELRGGDLLWPEIQKAIEAATAYAVVISPDAFQSDWVGDELVHALKVQEQRGRENYPVIPLALNGTKPGVFNRLLGEEPVYIAVSSDAGGVEAAMNALLVALGERLPSDVPATVQPKAEPLEELVLEVSDLKFHEKDGVRRASARARLLYEPATAVQPKVTSAKSWRLIAPIGPIEAEELRWYLEKYAIWPSRYFQDRARKVEQKLVEWGQLLYKTAMPVEHTANVMQAWARIADHVGRRFSVYVDTVFEAGADNTDAREVATLLVALPWELLHDGETYLFQGAKPVRVRRRFINIKPLDVPVVATPIRILLVTARPEDEFCGYFDHRASALPLVDAMESLPGLVKIRILSPPTLAALRLELERARQEKKPYHVVHFDGHGVFSRKVGLGGLCFENPDDTGMLEKRRHVTVFTDELGPLLKDHRVPLVFLEACQTAQADKASESVASELLKVGVASVVAMSHSVLVETGRRFVEAFFEARADGKRVGDAMLAAQRQLKDDTFRGQIFGAGELRLDDWFVPVLYQEKDDPQLFKSIPAKQTLEDYQTALGSRLGDLPKVPETGFIGRSRELLALQRLLREERYAVIRGQGGEGKTALAAEFARWMVRSQQMHRAALVSVEGLEKNIAEVIVDKLGHQLVKPGFSTQVDCGGDIAKAQQEIERVLREQPTLLVIDNMESVLLPTFIEKETPEALAAEAREELKAILALCGRLLKVGDTRVIFTSREALPEPFNGERNRRELYELDREDAVKLVERVLNAVGDHAGASSSAAREEIEELVDAVNCHARTLALLAPSLREHGVATTHELLVDLMAEMEVKFPGSREKSVFASVELSLRRMSQANQNRVRILGLFHGGVNLIFLKLMMHWEEADLASLASELVELGLATPNRYNHLTLNPALCPYLRKRLDGDEHDSLMARWIDEMGSYVELLVQQRNRNAEFAATLTMLELPNLFALLHLVQDKGDAETTIDLTTALYRLLHLAGKPTLLKRVGQVRDDTIARMGEGWTHAQFEAARTRIEQQLMNGQLREAIKDAQKLHDRAKKSGYLAYPDADYDIATAVFLLARTSLNAGLAEQALPLLNEAKLGFEAFEKRDPDRGAARMEIVCISEAAHCLMDLGRLEEAAIANQEYTSRAEQLGADRDVAVGKAQLGTIRMAQGNYSEALSAFAEARERFTELGEPRMVAVAWHQTGIAYQDAGKLDLAEDAYRKSLSIKVQIGDVAGEAKTLNQLGIVYDRLERLEDAATLYQQALDKSVESGDVSNEGRWRHNLASTLRKLRRFDAARQELRRAIDCNTQFGHVAEPWKTWDLLEAIETDASNLDSAAEAKSKAIACFLDYRREGGENQDREGSVSHALTTALLADDDATVKSLFQTLASVPDLSSSASAYIRTLQAVVDGSRDRSLADAPDLHYGMAAEILLLIETLEKRDSG